MFRHQAGQQVGAATFPAELIDPGCQGSLINQFGVLHTSNANTTSARTHVTVKTSTDQVRFFIIF